MREVRPANPRKQNWLWIFVAITALGVLLPIFFIGRVVWGRSDMGFDVTPSQIVIRFGPDDVLLNRDDVVGATLLPKPTGARRLVGTAMPGIYEGRWRFAETGPLRLYATRPEQVVVIETRTAGLYGITPEDPEGFMTALATDGTGTWLPAPGASPWPVALVLLGITIPMLIFVTVMLSYYIRLPLTIVYRLTGDALEISGGRLHLALPYGAITGAELMQPKGGPFRMWGAEMSGLLWGSFSWRSVGPSLKLYATQRSLLVVVRTGSNTYGITPAEPEQFLEELNKRLS